MNFEQLENLKEGSYIWLQYGRMSIGYTAKIVSVKNCIIKEIIIYSKAKGYENLKNLHVIGYNIVLLDNLDCISLQKLKKSCYIVIEFIHKEGINRYEADIFHGLKGNDILYLNGYEFRYNPLKHRLYEMPVPCY